VRASTLCGGLNEYRRPRMSYDTPHFNVHAARRAGINVEGDYGHSMIVEMGILSPVA